MKKKKGGSAQRQVAAAPTSSSSNTHHSNELNILESEVGKPISEEFDNSLSLLAEDNEETETEKDLFTSPLHSDSPPSSSSSNNIVSSSLPTWQIEDKRKKNKISRSSSTLASSLHSGYFKHTDTIIHATSNTLLSGSGLFEKTTTTTAGPPSSPKFLRVNESIDEKFNYQVINAIKQIHAEGERSMSGTHFFSSTSEDMQGILSNISSKHDSTADNILIEPSDIFMNFNNLSKDEVEIIISFLPLEDNLNMGLTSKYYYYLTIEDKFWKSILLSLPQRERISMQTVLYQLDFYDNYYNYNFTDLNTVYTPLNSMSETKTVENIDDIPEIGSINDNVTKIKSRDSSFSSSKSFYKAAGQELKSSSHLKRIPLKHQYILYKHHSKTVKKKERGKRAEDKIGIFFSKRCQPCMYIQLCILSLTTLLFITLSLIFSGLYYDNSLEKESAETLLTVSPAGLSLLWLPIFFLFISSLYIMMGWVPYLSSFFLTCYNRFHKKKSNDESTSLLHPNEEDSNAETSVFFVILRRLFFSSEMQENIDDPSYQLKMAGPSQLIWFSVLVLVIGLRFLIFKDQFVWRYLLIPVYIFQLFACVDFTYRGVRLWTLRSPFKRTISQLITIMLLIMNVNLIYLSSGTSLVLASLKLDNLSLAEHVKWSEVLTPAYVCLLLIHFNISILPYYAAKIFYNGFHSKKTTLLAVITPIPIVFFLLSPFTIFLILLSLRLDNLITLRYSLVLTPLYIGLSLYLFAVSIYSIVKLVKSKCCK